MNRREFLAAAARAGLASAALASLPPLVREALAKDGTPHLIERNQRPKHWETTLAALDGTYFTPVADFFLRSHLGDGGRIDPQHASLRIEGLVKSVGPLLHATLAKLPHHEIAACGAA